MDNTAIKMVSETITDAVMAGRYTVGYVAENGQERDIVPEGIIYVSGTENLDEAFDFVNAQFKGWSLRLDESHLFMITGRDSDVSPVHDR